MNEDKIKEIYLTTEEKARWMKFHEDVYKEDKKMSNKVLIDSPRWSIIMAYYAMHNISKLYLAKIHNIKISGEDVHAKILFFISKYVQQDVDKIIPLLEKAKENTMQSPHRVYGLSPGCSPKEGMKEQKLNIIIQSRQKNPIWNS